MERVRLTFSGSRGDDAQVSAADPDHVTRMQLPATPELGLTVDSDLAAGDQTLGICAARDDSGELEQLAEADHVASDGDVAHHASLRRYRSAVAPGYAVGVSIETPEELQGLRTIVITTGAPLVLTA